MLTNFYDDLNKARAAERLTLDTLAALTTNYAFEMVADQREYFYKGDILATDCRTGKQYFIEVKDDSRIAETRNILCEYEVYFKDGGYTRKGNMYCESDVFAIVSKAEQKIYLIDFKTLQANYKRG